MATARTDSETASKAQALREAADLGCTGAHRHPDGTWMACSTMEEYEKLTASSKTKSGLDLIAETQKIREQKGRRRKRKNRQWEKLRERGVSGIDTLPGGGLVSGKGMTFRPVDGDTDVFDDINKARRRARQLGCIGVARRVSRSGRRVWTPCTNMTDYARATGSTALGRRYQARLERQRIRGIVQEELSRAKRSGRRRKTSLFEELYEVKGLGRTLRRGATVFDANAWDGDNDGIVQEGTPFERPAIPGINTNLPGTLHTRNKPKNFPADTQRERKRRADAKKPRRDPNRNRPGDRNVQRRRRERAAGMRSEGSERPLLPRPERGAAYDPLKQGLEGVTEGLLDLFDPDRKKKKPLPKRERPMLPMKNTGGGLRSVSPSKAVNAPLEKTTKELSETYKRPDLPLKPGVPIAVQHATRSVEALERIAEDRFRLPGEQEGGARGGLDQVGLGGLYFTFEGDMIGADWDVEDEGSGEGSWMQMDTLVAAQVTPKRPLTIMAPEKNRAEEAAHWESRPDPYRYDQASEEYRLWKEELDEIKRRSSAALRASVLEQLGFKSWDDLHAAEAKRAKELGVDLEEARKRSTAGVVPELLGIDLLVTEPVFSSDENHQSGDLVVLDSDIIETVGVREIGRGSTHSWTHQETGYEPDWNPESNDSIRKRINRLFEQSSGMRSQRLTQSDLNQRRNRTPKENLSELGEAIDEYVGFLQEHHRHDFAGDGDVISAIDASNPGLVDEHDLLKGRIDDLAGVFEEARADLEEMDFERDELQDEVNRLVRTFDKANGDFLGSHSNSQMQRRQIVRAVRDGQDRDKFLQSEFPDEMAEDQGHMEWLWDTVVEERKEIMQLNKKLGELEDRIKTETLGSEETQETLRSMVQGRIDKHQKPDSSIEIGSGSRALDPDVGMRSRRDALSDTNKQWLRTLQENPGYWDEAPAAVRNVSSDQLRQEAMDLRGSSIRNTGGMRSGGRQKGQEILGKVKPEHTNKPSGERVLYFVGGTTGAGKSTIIKDKKIRLPDSTEAAHIDPDDIKTGLRGWDPKHPGNVHHESRRVTDRVMDDAMNSGMDVVVQGTGKRTEHLRDAKARGYKTSGHFVWIPDREADRRIVQRTAEGGPNIPTYFGSQIAGELRNGDGRFRGLSHDIAEGLYDEFYLWDNTGREPRLIAYRTQDGQFAIHGRKEFDDFFGASGRYVERYWQKNK